MQSRVSLAELIDAGVPVRPDEAVAILREVCRQYAAGDLHGIPNSTVIRLTRDGRIAVEGPVNRDQAAVPAAAALLAELLPSFGSANGFRVPGGLRLVLARATRTLDLPPFADMEAFCSALDRFASPDPADAVRGLFASWRARQQPAAEPGELTISDVRRARRATGLSLEDIASASGLQAERLRELEWGYTRNWRADDEGREALRRYARASGLDEDLVISVAVPLIEHPPVPVAVATIVDGETAGSDDEIAVADDESAIDGIVEQPAARHTWALVPAATEAIAPLPWPVKTSRPSFTRHRWALALAAAILLAIVGIATGWERPAPMLALSAAPAPPEIEMAPTSGPSDTMTPADDAAVRPATLLTPSVTRGTPSVTRVTRDHVVKAKPARKPARAATTAQQNPPQKKSFLKRELFRIVFK